MDAEAQFATYTSGHLEKKQNGAYGSTSNESAGKSLQLDPAAMGNCPFRLVSYQSPFSKAVIVNMSLCFLEI